MATPPEDNTDVGFAIEPFLTLLFDGLSAADGGSLRLSPETAAELQQQLRVLRGDVLADAVLELVRVAYHLAHNKQATEAADDLLSLAATMTDRLPAEFLAALPSDMAERLAVLGEKPARFEERAPPKEGETRAGPGALFALQSAAPKKKR